MRSRTLVYMAVHTVVLYIGVGGTASTALVSELKITLFQREIFTGGEAGP